MYVCMCVCVCMYVCVAKLKVALVTSKVEGETTSMVTTAARTLLLVPVCTKYSAGVPLQSADEETMFCARHIQRYTRCSFNSNTLHNAWLHTVFPAEPG